MRIIIAVLVFSVLVLIHELGHFLTAKKLGIRVYELAMGMGPKLFGKTVGETQYTIRAIPFGAYVRFSDDEDEFFQEPDNFTKQSPWNKIKVVLMGPLVNILFAAMVMIGVFYFNGFPTNKLATVPENMPAYEAGIRQGDSIIQIGYSDTNTWDDIIREISQLKINEKELRLQVKKENGQIEEVYVIPKEQEGRFVIGISPMYEKNIGKSFVYGIRTTFEQSTMMISTIKNLFIGRADINEFSGPVGIVNVVGEATAMGGNAFFVLVALISLNLGIINLVPIPVLDGSKILIYTYELITKKPMKQEIEARITIAGFLLLIGFSLFITYKDIIRLITG